MEPHGWETHKIPSDCVDLDACLGLGLALQVMIISWWQLLQQTTKRPQFNSTTWAPALGRIPGMCSHGYLLVGGVMNSLSDSFMEQSP